MKAIAFKKYTDRVSKQASTLSSKMSEVSAENNDAVPESVKTDSAIVEANNASVKETETEEPTVITVEESSRDDDEGDSEEEDVDGDSEEEKDEKEDKEKGDKSSYMLHNDELEMKMSGSMGFLYKTMLRRDPSKRRVKPVPHTEFLALLDGDASSDDSDFCIDEHKNHSDDEMDTNDEEETGGKDDRDKSSGSESSDEERLSEDGEEDKTASVSVSGRSSPKFESRKSTPLKLLSRSETLHSQDNCALPPGVSPALVCAACMGEYNYEDNEIVECDNCGIIVHENCYGVSELASEDSVSSVVSTCSTEPWFCDPCRAGELNPTCQLCPNMGGAFKETDTGQWVHLVCALYIPGLAFGEIEKLTQVTLFEMAYSRWGAKACTLCKTERLARTGVCIGCDAGMCRTFFHVTCAQKEGLLSDTYIEDPNQADPFYANCKLHTDRATARRRKVNWLRLEHHVRDWKLKRKEKEKDAKDEEAKESELARLLRKLSREQTHYKNVRVNKALPWVPTQKLPRMLTTSASALRRMEKKAKLMDLDAASLEAFETAQALSAEAARRVYLAPTFSAEYIWYFMERDKKINQLKEELRDMKTLHQEMRVEEKRIRQQYDQLAQDQQSHFHSQRQAQISLENLKHHLQSLKSKLCTSSKL